MQAAIAAAVSSFFIMGLLLATRCDAICFLAPTFLATHHEWGLNGPLLAATAVPAAFTDKPPAALKKRELSRGR